MTPLSARRDLHRIVLTGFMGSGKTTVGRLLARRLGWTFADLDDRVERREGLTVPRIFTERGEDAFRLAETRALAEALGEPHVVIALGGGAPGTAAVRDLLTAAAATAVVHLQAPFEVLYKRCASQALDPTATERPLLRERTAAQVRYEEREGLYATIAHHTVDASRETPEALAEVILRALPGTLESQS